MHVGSRSGRLTELLRYLLSFGRAAWDHGHYQRILVRLSLAADPAARPVGQHLRTKESGVPTPDKCGGFGLKR